MNIYEWQIRKLADQIKESEESPDPTRLRSNKLLYELMKEKLEQQLDVWQRGKPFAAVRLLERLVRSMGFEYVNLSYAADSSAERYAEYKPIIEGLGFPEKCCDRSVSQFAIAAMRDTSEEPMPHVVVISSHSCDALRLVNDSIARWYNIPAFSLDATLDVENEPSLDSLNYIADQLGEFAEWAEKKVPGVKYDEDSLREIQEIDALGLNYLREIYQLRKHVPCPIAPADAFMVEQKMMPREYPNMQKAIEYLRIQRDEIGERVASGTGPYPEERLRIIWAGGGPVYFFGPLSLLLKRKVALPMFNHGSSARFFGLKYPPCGAEVSEYGVKLSPLQEEARWLDTKSWGGLGKRWVNDGLDFSRDLGVHGFVHDLHVGCTPVLGIGTVLAERAEKELGIPVLNLENRHMDQHYFRTDAQFQEILSAFIDKCFDWAGKPRQ